MTDILTYIQENMSTFSKGQKLIANYILQSYDTVSYTHLTLPTIA